MKMELLQRGLIPVNLNHGDDSGDGYRPDHPLRNAVTV